METAVELTTALFCVVVLLGILARRVAFPFPILLVLAGVGLGLLPIMPAISIDPDVIFVIVLPPLLYSAAVAMPWHEFRANLAPIVGLAVGLVLVTTAAVALVGHLLVPGLPLAAAATLGAIVSPTDAISATAIARRLRVPHRVLTILEGESLVNDASGLVAYQLAVATTVTGIFTWRDVGIDFVAVGAGGILIGLGMGWLVARALRFVEESASEITVSLVTPYIVFLSAAQVHASGVLAVVAAGLYLGSVRTEIFSPGGRVEHAAVWATIEYLMNGLVFLLIGLQLESVVSGLPAWPLDEILVYVLAISAVVLGVRLVWVFPASRATRWALERFGAEAPDLSWQSQLVIGWSGMRGVISLAAALALPVSVHHGAPFPDRSVIVFLTFSVILTTLVLNGLTLPLVIRRLGVSPDELAEESEMHARLAILRAAVDELDRWAATDSLALSADDLALLRTEMSARIQRAEARAGNEERRAADAQLHAVYLEMLRVERRELERLTRARQIDRDVARRIELDIDFEESRATHPGVRRSTPDAGA